MTPNVTLIPNYYSNDLFDYIVNNCDFDRSMRARWTASFGKSYDYNGMSYPAITFPDNFSDLLNSINSTIGFSPNNCLINLYHDGNSSMGYHSDNTDFSNIFDGAQGKWYFTKNEKSEFYIWDWFYNKKEIRNTRLKELGI